MEWFDGSDAFRIDDVHVNLSGVCRQCGEQT
jgi:Fe2+ or Zn2+ uptake regulation protein